MLLSLMPWIKKLTTVTSAKNSGPVAKEAKNHFVVSFWTNSQPFSLPRSLLGESSRQNIVRESDHVTSARGYGNHVAYHRPMNMLSGRTHLRYSNVMARPTHARQAVRMAEGSLSDVGVDGWRIEQR